MIGNLVLLVLVAVASVHHFGWLDGFGILAVVYLLMPFQPHQPRR
jgi:hypothetical protein